MEVWTQLVTCKVSDAQRASHNFARDPLRSYFYDPQKNEIHLLYYIDFVYYLWNFVLHLANHKNEIHLLYYIIFIYYLWNFVLHLANHKKWNSFLILHRFCLLFVEFVLHLANKRRRKVIIRIVFGYYVQQPSLWHDANRPINYCIYLWCRLRRMQECCSQVHEPCRSKIGSSKEIVGKRKYSNMNDSA